MPPPEDRLRRTRARVRRHSRIVRWLKIALPLAALLLIGAIFLVGRERAIEIDPETAAQVAAMGTGMRLDNPRFSGVTEKGDPFAVTADRAVPDGAMPDRVDLENPTGRLQMGRQTITVTAEQGTLLRDEERLRLSGDVVLETSDGYRVETPSVRVDLAARTAEAPRRLRAVGPRGSIEADRARIVRGQGEDAMTIRFEGDVRVRWQPAGRRDGGG